MIDEVTHRRRVATFRVLASLNLVLGAAYLFWRYGYSLNTGALWLAVLLVVAETYG